MARVRGRRRFGAAVAAIILTSLTASDATAQVAPPESDPPSYGLDEVVVTSGTYREAVHALDEARTVLESAEDTIRGGERAIPDLEVAVRAITTAIPRLRSQRAAATDIGSAAQRDLHHLVAVHYALEASRPGPLRVFGEYGAYQDDRRLAVLLTAAERNRHATAAAASRVTEDANLQLEAATEGIGRVRELLAHRRSELGLAMADAERLDGQLEVLETAASVERRLGTVTGSDLTFVALEAYVTAVNSIRATDPACGLDWTVLAAIGRVESHHGTYGDTSLDVAGQTLDTIIGIALDGTRNTREIRDTDGGALDGDPIYDRAVGPMQFIPTTWVAWGRDGDGDNRADPHNLYDAATSAGAYLCAAGDFTSPERAGQAVFAYNHSAAYVAVVLMLANEYQSLGVTVQ